MKAVLLLGYGSPDKIEDVREYYKNILGGRPVREEAIKELERRYEVIGSSPFNRIVRSIASKLESELPEGHKVLIGMKNWKPYIRDVLEDLRKFDEVTAIALTPFYSKFHTERYFSELQGLTGWSNLRVIKQWFDSPILKDAWINVIRESMCELDNVIFTAHSLPEDEDDPYGEQFGHLVREIADGVGIKNWHIAFQSKPINARGKWLGPDIGDVVHRLQNEGVKKITIVPAGFTHDSLEVLYDLDHELPEKFPEVHFCRVNTLNDRDDFIKVLRGLVQ